MSPIAVRVQRRALRTTRAASNGGPRRSGARACSRTLRRLRERHALDIFDARYFICGLFGGAIRNAEEVCNRRHHDTHVCACRMGMSSRHSTVGGWMGESNLPKHHDPAKRNRCHRPGRWMSYRICALGRQLGQSDLPVHGRPYCRNQLLRYVSWLSHWHDARRRYVRESGLQEVLTSESRRKQRSRHRRPDWRSGIPLGGSLPLIPSPRTPLRNAARVYSSPPHQRRLAALGHDIGPPVPQTRRLSGATTIIATARPGNRRSTLAWKAVLPHWEPSSE